MPIMIKLMQMKSDMRISPIHTETDYQQALEKLEVLFDAKMGTEAGDALEILSILIDAYERENFPVGLPDPIEAIKFRMEQMGMKNKDLVQVIGFKSRVSEILNRKRKLSLEMIRQISLQMRIPTEVLVQEY